MIAALLRYRLWLVGAVALLNAVLDALGSAGDSDFFVLARPSRLLLSGAWLHALDPPSVQVGPLGLLWPAINEAVHDITAVSDVLLYSVTVYMGVAFGAVFLTRALYRHRGEDTPPWVDLWAGLAVVISGVGWTAVSSGQPFDVVVGILWVCVAVAARRDRPVCAGALFGIACAIKLNALLGLPLLLLIAGLRRRSAAAAVAGAIVVVLYGPFFLWGDAGMFEFVWRVSQNSFVSVLVDAGSRFTWEMRIVQSAVVVVGGTLAVFGMRRSPHVVWVAPFVIAVLRVITDPLSFGYYWLGAEAVAVAGIGSLFRDSSVPVRITLGAGYLALGLASLVPGAGTPIRLLLAAALILYLAIGAARSPTSVERAPAPV